MSNRDDFFKIDPECHLIGDMEHVNYYFEAHHVMTFLGRNLNGHFLGDIVTYQLGFGQMPKRLPGRRVKHRMKRNWMKMYDKEGVVLRVETVINDPEEFRIRRRVRRNGRSVMAWVPLRKGVAFLSRYQEICGQCNGCYPNALAHVDDPTPAIKLREVAYPGFYAEAA